MGLYYLFIISFIMNLHRSILIIAIIVISACSNSNTARKEAKEISTVVSGEQLFKINCAQCHRPDQDLIGPALKDVRSRWKNKALLYAFIHNPQDVVVKDPYAKELFNKWKQEYMQPFPNLSKEEIDRIFDYCDNTK